MKKRRLIAIVLSLCMILVLLAGCGKKTDADNGTSSDGTPNTTTPSTPDTGASNDIIEAAAPGEYLRDKIVVSSEADGGTFDPFTMARWGSCVMTALVFQKLANIDGDGTLYYEIAKSFDKVDDTHYTLEIWDSVYDSEGNHITADDVIWCFDQCIATGNAGAINKFDHFEKIDDYTLTWVCNAPFTAGELEKNLSNVSILSQKAYEESGSDMTNDPVGTGPYVLKEYTVGSTVVLEADEDFWMNNTEGATKSKWDIQNVKEIEYQIIQDASSRAIALEMGTIEIADTLDSADVDAFASNPDITPVLLPLTPPVAFVYNCSENSPFQDVNLRKAFAYALDNAAIADALAVPAYAIYGINPLMWDAPEDWVSGREYYDYNTDTAKEYLDKSSYNGESLRLMYTSSTVTDGVVIMIQEQLKNIGVTVELLNLDMSITMDYQYEFDKWDLRLITLGGGNYMTQTLKWFSAEESKSHFDNGETVMMVRDDKLEELWADLLADTNPDTLAAWDDYFTFDQCYAYAICCYSNQTACRNTVNVVQGGSQSNPLPNACTFND